MDIGKLNDGEAAECRGQIGDWNFIRVYLKAAAFDIERITCQQSADAPVCTPLEKLSSIHEFMYFDCILLSSFSTQVLNHITISYQLSQFNQLGAQYMGLAEFSAQGVYEGGVHFF